MAIKAGQIVHVGNDTVVIDRVQTGGPGQLNIPTEKVYELGNYKSVGTIRDVPDLTFSLDSFDVSTEIETMLATAYAGRTVAGGASGTAADATLTVTGGAFTSADVGRMVVLTGGGTGGADLVTTVLSVTDATHVELATNVVTTVSNVDVQILPNGIDLATSPPIDIASQFKSGLTAAAPYEVISSIALPFLYLEQFGYRFGLRDNATQSISLRGDAIFYNPGSTYVEVTAGTNAVSQAVVTTYPAYQVAGGDERRVLSVTVGTKRLSFGADYTETYGTVTNGAATTTVTLAEAVPTNTNIRIMYSSPQVKSYLANVHPSSTVKPAAVRGKDIDIYVGGYDPNDVAGSQVNKLTSVQSVNVDWRVTLEKDEEFGNYYAVGQDFDVPTVTGSFDFKPRDPAELLTLIRQAAGVSDPLKIVGATSATPLEFDVVIKNPDTSEVMKRIHVPDARFTTPGFQGRVQTKSTVTVNFESDEGTMIVYAR